MKPCRDHTRFRERVTIQQRTTTENASGEVLDAWSTYCERFAQVSAIKASERVADGRQMTAEVGYRIRLVADSATRQITPQMRVLFAGRILQIGGQIEEGDRRELILLICTERLPA